MHILTTEELRAWGRQRTTAWRSTPSTGTMARWYATEHGELSLLSGDDGVTIYARVANATGIAQRTHKPGSDVARRLWALKHKEAS